MPLLPNPWVILAALAIGAGLFGGGYYRGAHVTQLSIAAEQAREDKIVSQTNEKLDQATATLLAKIDKAAQSGRGKLETIIREVPVSGPCVNPPDLSRMLDEARQGRFDTESAGDRQLSGAGPSAPP